MSKITLAPNASGSGTLTIAAPNTNTDRTLTLPDATGTVNISGLANEVPAGSAGSPSIYSTGDSNTGVFFPAADTVAVSTGGTEAMRINASGNVGIGTTSPNGLLEIASTAPNIYLKETEQAADEKLWKFALNSKTFSLQTATDANGFGASSIVIGRGTGTAIDYQAFRTGANVERMRIDSSGNVGIGGVTPASNPKLSMYGGIRFLANETAAATYTGIGSIASDTVCVSTSGSERMRIDSSGNLLFNSGYGSVATAYGCRAWVKFNSSGGVNGSGNVTSVTNNAVGSFTINFTTAMPDTNYAAVGSCGNTDVAGDEEIVFFPSTRIGTSTLGYRVSSGSGAAASVAVNFVSVFR